MKSLIFLSSSLLWLVSHATSQEEDAVVPSWQSVVSDEGTRAVVRLFGPKRAAWRLYSSSDNNSSHSVPARVPGDILTDLMDAKVIGDPYYDRNFLTQRVWMGNLNDHGYDTRACSSVPSSSQDSQETLEQRTQTWVYSTEFFLPDDTNKTMVLVLEGIKMGASLALNGVPIGENVTDQFLRYTFHLPAKALQKGRRCGHAQEHRLTVTFDPSINTNGRFMACSGGWDWAPYSKAGDARGSRVFTFGITQPMYIVPVTYAYITDVVPKMYYQGPYPRAPLWDGPAGDFIVRVEVHIRIVASKRPSYSLRARSDFSNETFSVPLTREREQRIVFNMTASKDVIDLWWPNGLGAQPLYSLEVTLEDAANNNQLNPWIRRRIGFRTVALVTTNETDDFVEDDIQQKNAQEGSGRHGMYFRVNGAVLWSRGANFVPMDQLEGRLSDEAHRLAVQSAASANMNMLRVWGGGAILLSSFYDACDERGILLYHDMMFVEEENHGAIKTPTIRSEIVHTVRKLAAHPAIVLWNGCNECSPGSMGVYESFVMSTVAQEDDTRAIWPSSPSRYGWATGVYTVDGRPNGHPLKVQSTGFDLEAHGPYQRGYSSTYPGVNGSPAPNANETHIPPQFGEWHPDGAMFRNIFVSEFGASVFSSFESMSAYLPESSWGVHGGSAPDSCQQVVGNYNTCNGTNTMAERNYPCDSRIEAFFGNVSLDSIGRKAFQRQLYWCMISQTLWMKGQIEIMRSSNTFGTLIWQLNENWPTGGWGCIEYGSRRMLKNQVIGGRWKPLMHLLERNLFRDVIVACGDGDRCYARNDGLRAMDVFVWIEAWNLTDAKPLRGFSWYHHLKAGRFTEHFSLPGRFKDDADVVLIEVSDDLTENSLVKTSAFLWKPPKSLPALSQHSVQITIEIRQDDEGIVTIELNSDYLALYVLLSTVAAGRFSDNAFHLRPGQRKIVRFDKLPTDDAVDMKLFRRSLRVEHLGQTSVVTRSTATE